MCHTLGKQQVHAPSVRHVPSSLPWWGPACHGAVERRWLAREHNTLWRLLWDDWAFSSFPQKSQLSLRTGQLSHENMLRTTNSLAKTCYDSSFPSHSPNEASSCHGGQDAAALGGTRLTQWVRGMLSWNLPRNFMVTKVEHLGTSKLRIFHVHSIHNGCDMNDMIVSWWFSTEAWLCGGVC